MKASTVLRGVECGESDFKCQLKIEFDTAGKTRGSAGLYLVLQVVTVLLMCAVCSFPDSKSMLAVWRHWNSNLGETPLNTILSISTLA